MSSVEDYMNARMVMRDSKASVIELAKVMVDWSVSSVAITDKENKNKVRHLLVEDPASRKGAIGIISTTDLARYLQKRMKQTAADMEEEKEEEQKQQSSSSS